MMRLLILLLAATAVACASVPPAPRETDFAQALLARRAPSVVDAPATTSPSSPVHESPAPENSPGEWERLAADEAALDAFLAHPVDAEDLAALAVLRSGEVTAARRKLEAARTGYRQSADLDDLAAIYRSYSRDLDTTVGPSRHRRPAAAIAPSPNVAALSGEVVDRTVGLAREKLRSVELSVAARARRIHAEVALWSEERRVVEEDLRLLEGLLAVMKARLEGGQASQAGYLAFSAAVARRRTELDILKERAPSLRTTIHRLLDRSADATLSLDWVADTSARQPLDADALVQRALGSSPDTRSARLRRERAEIAVRLAETMTLPRLDIGSARFERERAGEAGVDRGAVFPDPGRMLMVRSDFGVKEAQVTEMRARAEALAAGEKDTRLATAAAVRDGLFSVVAAEMQAHTLADEVVPLADRALRATKGSYEANRVGYLDLLEAARRRLTAELDSARAARDVSVARANLRVVTGFDPWKETDR